jgi:uncharacterized protein YjbJ (UPF0337 family)
LHTEVVIHSELACGSSDFHPGANAVNKDQIKGKVQNLKGRIREAVGVVSGNRVTMAKGAIARAKGALREKVGDVKEDATRKVNHSGDQ